MARQTYSLHAIVLRKTKLGESDLILTLLAEDGRQVRAVAKGARKPNSSFSSRLEIFAEVEALMASGKSLDIVKEVRLVDAHQGIVFDAQHAAACAPVVDLASRLTQPDLVSPKMFALLSSALGHACSCNAEEALAVCAAFMLKRPSPSRDFAHVSIAASAAESPCLYRARKRRETLFCFLQRKGAWSVRGAFCSRMRSAFPSRSYRGRISCLCRRSMTSWLQGLRAGLYLKYCISANLGCASMWVPA